MSGIDSCGVAELCFGVDDKGVGECVAFCGGTEFDPVCPEGQACSVTNEGVLTLCLPTCDPLASGCDDGEGCFPVGQSFVCLPAPSDEIIEPSTCYQSGGCEPGTVCVATEWLSDCDDIGCCTPWCDVSAPVCPLDTECTPWFEEGAEIPPGYENVGVCIVPK